MQRDVMMRVRITENQLILQPLYSYFRSDIHNPLFCNTEKGGRLLLEFRLVSRQFALSPVPLALVKTTKSSRHKRSLIQIPITRINFPWPAMSDRFFCSLIRSLGPHRCPQAACLPILSTATINTKPTHLYWPLTPNRIFDESIPTTHTLPTTDQQCGCLHSTFVQI